MQMSSKLGISVVFVAEMITSSTIYLVISDCGKFVWFLSGESIKWQCYPKDTFVISIMECLQGCDEETVPVMNRN